MSRMRVAVSAIHLIRRGGAMADSLSSGILAHPFSLYSSNFHSCDRPSSPKVPYIDFSRVRELDDAVHLFHDMLGMRPQPSVSAYIILLNIAVKLKHYSFALYMFDEMRRVDSPVNEITTTIAIHCYCLIKRVDLGFATLGFFFKSGYEPDVTTFTTLVKGLFLEDKVADAVKLFYKLLDFGMCEPNDVMILTVIDGLCKAGHIIEAHDLVHRLEETRWRPNVIAYNALIDGLCRGGMMDDALQLLSKMIDNGISPDVLTYSSMIRGLCDGCRWRDVTDLLNEMADSNISLDVVTFTILMNALCKEGKMEEAEQVLENMVQNNISPNIVTYTTLIDGYCLRGDIEKAKQVFYTIADRGLKPDIVCYNTLINGYCKMGRADEAWLLFLEIPCKSSLTPTRVTYNVIVHSLLLKGELGKAIPLLEEMHQRGFSLDAFTFSMLIDQAQRQNEDGFLLKLMKNVSPKEIVL